VAALSIVSANAPTRPSTKKIEKSADLRWSTNASCHQAKKHEQVWCQKLLARGRGTLESALQDALNNVKLALGHILEREAVVRLARLHAKLVPEETEVAFSVLATGQNRVSLFDRAAVGKASRLLANDRDVPLQLLEC
jgi:hypothetical protein